ncbi:MAG: ATP-binding protein, partial [Pseudomonadota bacterium]
MVAVPAQLLNPDRLAALQATALLDSPIEESFDRLTRLAARFLAAPISLVTLVDTDRQFLKSGFGVPEPIKTARETPLDFAFCHHNLQGNAALMVPDARVDVRFATTGAVQQFNVRSYLGVPLVVDGGYVIGSLCVLDYRVREWSEDELRVLSDLAGAVTTEIQIRTEIRQRADAERERAQLSRLNHRLESEIAARTAAEQDRQRLQNDLLQTRKMEAVGRLAGGVAHDLNNLLTPILGYCELLVEAQDLSNHQSDAVLEIRRAGSRARDLVRQLLAPSRRQTLQLVSVNVNQALTDLRSFLRRITPEDIELRFDLSDVLPPILADVTQVEQIVINLAANASDAMPRGGTLSISTCDFLVPVDGIAPADIPKEPYVVLQIADSGSGMTPEVQEHIFEPFYSVSESGRGLGLAVVYGIVNGHKGLIRIRSDVGKGTAFRVLIPETAAATTADAFESTPA